MEATTIESIIANTTGLLRSVIEQLPELAGWRRKADAKLIVERLAAQVESLSAIYAISRQHVNTLIYLDACIQSVAIIDKSKEHFMAVLGRVSPHHLAESGARHLHDQLELSLRVLSNAETRLEGSMEIRDAAVFISHLAEVEEKTLFTLVTEFEASLAGLKSRLARMLDVTHSNVNAVELTWENSIVLFDPVLRPLRKMISILTASVRNEFQHLARNTTDKK